jgi:hypothetical protein
LRAKQTFLRFTGLSLMRLSSVLTVAIYCQEADARRNVSSRPSMGSLA